MVSSKIIWSNLFLNLPYIKYVVAKTDCKFKNVPQILNAKKYYNILLYLILFKYYYFHKNIENFIKIFMFL
jgi:hypothetical protein